MKKKMKLVHHVSVRTAKIYDGSIRHPRSGVNDNKSVGLKLNSNQAMNLMINVIRFIGWNGWRKFRGQGNADLLITAYKYNKGPAGHATTLTSHVRQ